jgi:outer membrane protein OmpA-like peptidoglycan-associated protein
MLRLKKIYVILSSALLLAAVPAMSQDAAAAEAAVEDAVDVIAAEAVEAAAAEAVAPPATGKRNRHLEIEAYIAKLDSLFSVLKGEKASSAAHPVYVKAKGKLREAGSLINKKPSSQEASVLFSACSTSAVAAIIQLQTEINMVDVRRMNAKRDSLLYVLHNLHETINRIEGNRANRLSQDLEAAKTRGAMLQGDLEATKSDLEATKARAAAERERFRKEKEEANKRFDALKSDQLGISRDARGTILTMADILFETGKADLKPALRENLATIAGILIVYKDSKILIEGHTDNVGTKEFNQKLSEDRAANVLKYLVEKGVPAERLSSLGHAFEKPICPENTKECQAKNRRVELIVQDVVPPEAAEE